MVRTSLLVQQEEEEVEEQQQEEELEDQEGSRSLFWGLLYLL